MPSIGQALAKHWPSIDQALVGQVFAKHYLSILIKIIKKQNEFVQVSVKYLPGLSLDSIGQAFSIKTIWYSVNVYKSIKNGKLENSVKTKDKNVCLKTS